MSKLPSLIGKQVIDALQRSGFVVMPIKGSHHCMRHADGRATVVPVHAGEMVGPGLLSKILRDCELTRDELQSRL